MYSMKHVNIDKKVEALRPVMSPVGEYFVPYNSYVYWFDKHKSLTREILQQIDFDFANNLIEVLVHAFYSLTPTFDDYEAFYADLVKIDYDGCEAYGDFSVKLINCNSRINTIKEIVISVMEFSGISIDLMLRILEYKLYRDN